MRYLTTIGDHEYVVEVLDERHVSVDGQVFRVDFDSVSGQPVYSLIVDGQSFEAYVFPNEEEWQVLMRGRMFTAIVEDEREKRLRLASGGGIAERAEFHLKSPMPGLVINVLVGEGQEVKKGEVLIILESMKMQNELKSPKNGVISRLRVRQGETVEQRQTLLSVV